jgi:hypothetical protein
MKKSAPTLCLILGIVTALSGSVIADHDTALKILPNADAPIIAILRAGASYTPATLEDLPPNSPDLPTNWIAINHQGSFKGFVTNNNIRKDLSIAPGASIYPSPSSDAPAFTMMESDDDAVFVSPEAGWSQIVIRKTIPLYINTSDASIPVDPTPLMTPDAVNTAAVVVEEPPPALITTETVNNEPEAVADQPELSPMPTYTEENADADASLPPPRLFNGTFEKTKRFLGRKPKYDYRLLDSQGKTLLYLDLSTLLITDPLENYLGLQVNVFGTGRVPVKSKYLLIKVESLRLTR